MSDPVLRQYLLGRLTEEERHQIEERAFEDDAFEDRLSSIEYDLLDDWARGVLSVEDRLIVESRFPADKRASAKVLSARVANSYPGTPSRRWWLWAAAAVVLVGLIPAVYYWTGANAAPIQQPVAKQQAAIQIASIKLTVRAARPG